MKLTTLSCHGVLGVSGAQLLNVSVCRPRQSTIVMVVGEICWGLLCGEGGTQEGGDTGQG